MAKAYPKPVVLMSSTDPSVRIGRRTLEELVAFVSAAEGMRVGEVDLAIVGLKEMSGLNRRYTAHAGATDVLSFDLSDDSTKGICAQIIICGEVARKQGAALGNSPRKELMTYIVHGLLHVMGYDDLAIRAAAKMHARQDELLEQFLAKQKQRNTAKRSARPRG